MKNLFNLDSPIFQFLSRLADLIIVNVLFLVCSIPIFTIGAASVALAKVTQDMVLNAEGKLTAAFFTALKTNFKQATITWLIVLLAVVGLVFDYLLITPSFSGTAAYVMMAVLLILAILVIGVSCYMFQLMARYQNTLREHLSNAVILLLAKLPRTLGMVAAHCFAPALLVMSPVIFVQMLIFWLIIGFAFVSFLDSLLLRPVFRELETSTAGEREN